MKERFPFKNIFYMVLIFSLISLPVTANAGRKEKRGSHLRDQIKESRPESDLKKVETLVAEYKRKLAAKKGSRDQALANLAHLYWILGVWGEKNNKKECFEQGRDYAKTLSREKPNMVEGHYWLAMNLGGLASMNGNLKMVPRIVKEMKIAARIDERYNQAGPHRVLGRIYFQAPPWPLSVGDLQKSLKHLSRAIKLFPNNSTNRLYFAETLNDLKKADQACQEFKKVFAATEHANWIPSLKEDQQKAQELMGEDCKENSK